VFLGSLIWLGFIQVAHAQARSPFLGPIDDLLSDLMGYDHYLSEPEASLYSYPSRSSSEEAEATIYSGTVEATPTLQSTLENMTDPHSYSDCVAPVMTPASVATDAQRISASDPLFVHARSLGLDEEIIRDFLSQGVPYQPLYRSLEFWARNPDVVENRNRLTLVDFSLHANDERFWVLNFEKGEIQVQTRVAGGSNSDPRPRDGYIESCSHSHGSMQSSYGAMRISRSGFNPSKNWGTRQPHDLTLQGLEPGVNDNTSRRGIWIHGTPYCHQNTSCMGRSHGCFAIPQGIIDQVDSDVSGGSLLSTYAPPCEDD
jgi:hypothetical protein